MRIVRGDLLRLARAGDFDVIVHGCNCQCQMGKGIALQIKNELPEAFAADRATKAGDASKLGTFSSARIERDGVSFVVVNAYTQLRWRGAGVKADYDAIRGVARALKVQFAGKRIGYPRIGAGLAGGDWDRIATILDAELDGESHTLVEYAP